ncbi:MAG: tRNA (guanosine(37)-N1)-methyltransferase TrmD [Deltaproteobacteria bacterium]|nr:tRNA (guanosine(37)-N1)-methyltransferase TrmD [Deltaproteobacteria bacterium]
MRFDVVTIFPEMFSSPLGSSILKRAEEKQLISCAFHNPRDFTTDRHRTVDDTPYGGGAGMVMKPEPLVAAIESIPETGKRLRILLTPAGLPFTQTMAHELASYDQLVLVCGRYEGVDERVCELAIDREIAVGDAVVSGGEIPALFVIDAVSRLLPGVLGNESSLTTESFEQNLLEGPQYTRPPVFRGLTVPDVLLEGNHAEITRWRHEQAVKKTGRNRPDLLKKGRLDD